MRMYEGQWKKFNLRMFEKRYAEVAYIYRNT